MRIQFHQSRMSFEHFDESLAMFDGQTTPTARQDSNYELTVGEIGDVTIQQLFEGGPNFYQSAMEQNVVSVAIGLSGFDQVLAMGHHLNPESMVISRAGEESFTRCSGQGRYFIVTVPLDRFEKHVERFDPSQYERLLEGEHKLDVFKHNYLELRTLVASSLGLLMEKDGLSDAQWRFIEEELFCGIVSSIAESPRDEPGLGRPRISRSMVHTRVRQFCKEVRPDKWTVPGLAGHAGVHERSLRNVFLDLYGVSPKRYLTNLRLSKVRRDLSSRNSDLSVSQAASRAGFWQWGYMSREYRKLFGESPSATRSKA